MLSVLQDPHDDRRVELTLPATRPPRSDRSASASAWPPTRRRLPPDPAAVHHGQGWIRPLPGLQILKSVHLAARSPHAQMLLLATDLLRDDVLSLRPDYGFDLALELFARNNLLALPVVQDARGRRVVGIVRRSDIASAYLRRVHGERPLGDVQ